MAHSHSLDGLIKWAGKDAWREELAWVLEQHFGPACEELGAEMDELPDLVGGDHVMNLWGCAFEDLIAREIDGRNIADDYLKRRGWKESASTRAYIKALRQSVTSLYEVSGIRRDQGFFVRDLLRDGEPVWINEKSGTRYLAQWDRISARVLTVNGRTQLAGGLLRFDRELSDELIAALNDMANTTSADLAHQLGELARETGEESDEETRAIIDALQTTEIDMSLDGVLASGSFMFSTFWLRDTLDRALNPRLPRLINSDGEPIEWIEMRYPLSGETSPAAVRKALAGIPSLRQEEKSFWNWFKETPERGHGKSDSTAGEGRMLFSQLDDGTTVLGTLELARRTLTVSVNSEGRMERARALIEPALGSLLRAPSIERKTTDELLAEKHETGKVKGRDSHAPAGLSAQENAAITHGFLDSHYANTLDEPVPALGNMSPRSAASAEASRAKVVDWLKRIENHHARAPSGDPMGQYDCGWMWDELDLRAYRRA